MNRFIVFTVLLCIHCSCSKSNSPQPAQLGAIKVIDAGINKAIVANTIISTGNSELVAKGICWSSKITFPTLDNSTFSINQINNSNIYYDTLKGLTFNTKYYLRSYATNQDGTSYGAVDSFYTLPSTYTIGEFMEGGNVLYIDSTGEHGLIAARYIYVKSCRWANDKTDLGVRATDIGTGFSNTMSIISAGNDSSNTAAAYCNNLVADGYDDWFLPAYGEMFLFRNNLTFTQWLNYPWNMYWSSSEADGSEAFIVVIGGYASFRSYDKTDGASVLPMRRY